MSDQIWNTKLRANMPMPEEIRVFLDELEALCRKHNMTIAHEDNHGAFLINKFSQDNIDWLRGASDDRED